MDKKKIFNAAGAIIGVITILLGIIIIFSPATSYTTHTADDVSFGADFYTYEYEATRYAAHNAGVTANNIRELGEKIAFYSGSAFVIAGLLIVIRFLEKLLCCENPTAPVLTEDAPTAEFPITEGAETVAAETVAETEAVTPEADTLS